MRLAQDLAQPRRAGVGPPGPPPTPPHRRRLLSAAAVAGDFTALFRARNSQACTAACSPLPGCTSPLWKPPETVGPLRPARRHALPAAPATVGHSGGRRSPPAGRTDTCMDAHARTHTHARTHARTHAHARARTHAGATARKQTHAYAGARANARMRTGP